ncbi:peptidase S41-like protein [Edaphobacter aggregans]|uniref:Peptidase S41-like protein n=1 Tax=Edaphobacter aggregans TaxID=570835 RepID=A0A428MJB3_9BACT|nr:S41 family peptidase [Edaphobacter aggregans]RSL17034.1 peptidase S41-like protein [Edaphobacter aggregans]
MTAGKTTQVLYKLFVFFLISAGCALAQVTIPDTPAGHTLQAWLDAFNSGDRAKVEAYVTSTDPSNSVDGMLSFRSQTGGFDLLSIESSDPLHIRFRVKEKGGTTTALGNLIVKSGQPPTVATFGLRALPPGAVVENVKIDAAMRKKVVDGIETNLNEYYVEPTVAQQMVDAMKLHAAKGDYDNISDGDELAMRLTKDLQDVSHDKHLRIDFTPFKTPERTGPTPEDEARFHQQMEHANCAFQKVEILPGNIGYIKFDGFMDAGFCGPTVNAAMAFIAHTDAVIFDIRQNGGGQPAMVTLIASYLFDQPKHLIDIYNRKEDSTTQNWTLSYLPGPRLSKQPVFVLTSKRTFSGAEEFAFDLKNQKRATIIGETTGGGAHPVSGHTVADYFNIGVPFAKSLDPVTKTNWEGTGVEPDVKVPAADALTTAQKLAPEKIQAGKSDKK